MKRKLLRQIINEWRSNIWLALELVIVSSVMWWLCDQLWVMTATYNEPLGFDISHCYRISVSELNHQSPDFREYPDYSQETVTGLSSYAGLRRVRRPRLSARA